MGFFDDAEVEVNEISEDPFGFGNDYWPVKIVEIKDPEVTKSGDKVGMMVKWAVDHPKYANHFVGVNGRGLGNGNWTQIPVPKALQNQVPWDPKNDQKHAEVLINLRKLFEALGFSADEMGGIGRKEMTGRKCLAKIRVSQDDNGFWKFNLPVFQMKPLPDGDGMNEFASNGNSDEDELKKGLQDLNSDDDI